MAFIGFDMPVPPSASPRATLGRISAFRYALSELAIYQPSVSWHQTQNPVERHSSEARAIEAIAVVRSVPPCGPDRWVP